MMSLFTPLYNRIWKKFTIALLAVTFLPIGYFMYRDLNEARTSIEDREARYALQNVMIRAKEVEHTLLNALSDVNYLRSSLALEMISNLPRDRPTGAPYWKSLVENEFINFLLMKPGYSSVGLVDEYGDEKLVIFKNGEKTVSMRSLHNRLTSTYYVEAARQEGYGIAAIPMGSMVSSRTDVHSQPLIRLATKIFDRSGKPRGVIYADLNGAEIISKLSHTSIEMKKQVAMVTQKGDYIFNPYRKAGGEDAISSEGGNIKDEFSGAMAAQTLSGKAGLITDDPKYILAFRPVFLQSGNKDYFYVIFDRYPRENLVPLMDKVKKEYMVRAAEALALCIVVLAGVSFTLTRNLEKLREGVEKIRLHELDHRLHIRSRDEIETLADAYNMMADSLREYNRTLEKKVEERSNHIKKVEKKLMQTEKLAAIGFLAAGVAHEINNPISILITRLELIRKDLDRGKLDLLKKDLDVLFAHSVRIGAIARNLLTFSRSSSAESAVADLNEVTDRVLSLVESPIVKKGIKLERRLEPGLPKASFNIPGMEQVIYNIVFNACQATEAGGKIVITTGVDKEGGVRLEVRDTGHGIKPEVIDHIFEPFFTTKEVGSGTGLGLAISYGIVKDIGGSINVESEPGMGAVFTIHIPAANQALAAGAPSGGERG